MKKYLFLLLLTLSVHCCFAQSKSSMLTLISKLDNRVHNCETAIQTTKDDNWNRINDIHTIIQQLNDEIATLKTNLEKANRRIYTLEKEIINSNTTQSSTTSKTTTTQTYPKPQYSTKAHSSNSSSKPATAGRCQAITKKGTQCSRNAQAGSNYCWQHQR